MRPTENGAPFLFSSANQIEETGVGVKRPSTSKPTLGTVGSVCVIFPTAPVFPIWFAEKKRNGAPFYIGRILPVLSSPVCIYVRVPQNLIRPCSFLPLSAPSLLSVPPSPLLF